MKIALPISIASDHNGFQLKQQIIELLSKNYQVLDLGPDSDQNAVDYPDYAKRVCENIVEGISSFGVLICGTGLGMAIAANRFSEIRAANCFNLFMAERARLHNDANILVLGNHINSPADNLQLVEKFFSTSFEGGRHKKRLDKIS